MGLLDNMRAAADAETWTPSGDGDGIEGVVVAIDRNRSSDYTPRYTAITLRTADGRVLAFHAYHKVAAEEVEAAFRKGLQVGDAFAVVYTGLRAPKNGRGKPFHHHLIAHESNRPAPAAMPDLPDGVL